MKIIQYRVITIFITSILIGGVIFATYNPDIFQRGMRIHSMVMHGLTNKLVSTQTNNITISSIPISVRDIVSARYLYTLTKYIENELSIRSGTGIVLQSDYATFGTVTMSGSNFTFILNTVSVDIPISSYFFDTWSKKSTGTVSGEMHSNTGITNETHPKVIALTFDDGPSPKYTNILLDILKRENVKATFYVLGSRVEEYPNILKREYAEGHEIGNHSYSHTLLTKISERALQEELYKTDQAIYKAINIYPRTFRPPYGGVNTGVLDKSAMPAILWSIDTHDWRTMDVDQDIAAVANAKDGDIIIIHDIHKTSIESIPGIIKNLKEKGFTFVTISQLLSLSDGNTQIGKKCTKKGSCK